jgi:serine/threonine-protein kinase
VLFDEIGRGGMGAVFKGRDTEIGRELAVKMLLEEHRQRPEYVRRFVEEAQIAGQLQHPGVAPVYEMGRCHDDRPFFTMKLVKGLTLAELLRQRPDAHADLGRFLGIFLQVCQTLAYAHSHGVIHRDLKPSNVMVGSYGEVQVMDWGLAKVMRNEAVGAASTPSEHRTLIQIAPAGATAEDSHTGVMGTSPR